MSDIAIIKGKELYKSKYLRVLQNNLKHTVKAVNANNPDLIRSLNPGLIIVDIEADIDLTFIKEAFRDKNSKVAVSCPEVYDEQLVRLFRMDLQGYLLNKMKPMEAVDAIEWILNGIIYVHPHLVKPLFMDFMDMNQSTIARPKRLLTKREWQIVELLATGEQSNPKIADILQLSEKTVKNHLASIMCKLNVDSRTGVAVTAIRNRWVRI
ncbi:response regulator transcription factor [Virgibacillus sediminis]|uniref:Response regulator transcription factor n=1 Tax=Virgibacillus sediminis TaxID=202260 RepID=A0ABV7A3N0_9BACI